MFGLNFNKINLQKLPISKIIAIGAIIWALLATKSCNLAEVKISQKDGVYLKLYENQKKEFSVERNAANKEVATQVELVERVRGEALELKKQLLKQSLLKTIERSVTTTTENDFSGVEAKFITPISEDLADSIIPINTHFADSTEWYTIKGTILADRIHFDSLTFTNKLTINYGEKRDKGILGYLKKPTSVVEVINQSPYAKTTEIQNITFKQKRIKPIAYITTGFILGAATLYLIKK